VSEIEIRSVSGDVVGRATLDDAVFGAQINVPVMHQVVRAQLAAARAGTHSTKTRADVSGGGKKPWRQKGTGRARQGSIRAPHWTGGGVVFGPQPRSYEMKVPRKMRALALRSALSDRAREGRIAVVDTFAFEAPKTKDAMKALEALGVQGKSLVVLEGRDDTVGLSFRNLPKTHVILVDQLNTYDVLNAEWIVFTKAALARVGERATAKNKKAAPTEESDGGEGA
jgi:large subunit ribosomal protein L4